MKRPSSTAEAVRRIISAKPKTLEDFEKIGIPLGIPFGGGSFRDAYMPKNKKLILVVKFPVGEGTYSGIVHSRAEVKKIKKLSKFRILRKHLPKVYYHHSSAGIVVMHRYKNLSAEKSFDKLGTLAGKLIHNLTGTEMTDIQSTNVMGNGSSFVFVDLGY